MNGNLYLIMINDLLHLTQIPNYMYEVILEKYKISCDLKIREILGETVNKYE